jgi:hypothetical protein
MMLQIQRGLRKNMKDIGSHWRKFLNNPVWYVAIVTALAVLTLNIHFLWWLAGVVALVWGIWLIWQLFTQNKAETSARADPLRGYLDQTLTYQAQIDQLLKTTSNTSNRAHRLHLATQISLWTEAVQDLIQHLASLHQDNLIRQDMAAVPKAIQDLEARLAYESEPGIRAQLEHALINRKNQLATLQFLQNTMKKAEIQIESTLSLLGTIYSQVLISQSTSHMADYSRLSVDVDEEVRQLQDQLEALWEVKGGYQVRSAAYLFTPLVDHNPS